MDASAKAVFLSYASQDAEAAARLAGALRAAGVETWFDRSELRGGAAWDASIRRQIRECALFVPVISAGTEARSEGYFRREWNLAVDRMLDIAEDRAFLLPVVIDGTHQATARVPDRFRERQWSRIENDGAAAEWAAHVATLLGAAQPVASEDAPLRPLAPAIARRRRRWIPAVAGVAAVALAAVIGVAVWKGRAASDAVVTAPSPNATAATAPALDPKGIAVLPFENLSGRPEDAYLADGLQEEVLNALARVRDLKVVSRTSTQEYRGKALNVREIGQRLGVGSILEGSIRRDGNTLRLTVQLIDARNDRHLFAANYDRDMGHVLELQSAVARQVAGSLSATLTRNEQGELERVGTNNGDAYDRYLRAVALYRREAPGDEFGLNEPKRLLLEALRFDPDYADALALLSQANTWLYFHHLRPADNAAAREAFVRALAIDPRLPEAVLARGLYEMYVTTDLDRALVDLTLVARARPSSAEALTVLGFALRRLGRTEEALDRFQRAWDLDPLNTYYADAPVITLLGLRRYPEALDQTRRYSQRIPDERYPSIIRARLESRMQKSFDPLRALLRDQGANLGADRRAEVEQEIAVADGRYQDALALEGKLADRNPVARGVSSALLYAAAGDKARAEAGLRAAIRSGQDALKREPELARQVDFIGWLAVANSMLGDHAAAIALIDALHERYPEAREATNGPYVSFLRSVILIRAGRTDEGRAEAKRLLRVPFGSPIGSWFDNWVALTLLTRDDPQLDELVARPPRL